MRRLLLSTAGIVAAASAAAAQEHVHPQGDSERLGRVAFTVSCAPGIQPKFERAVAMLHSFWFEAAHDAFSQIEKEDPDCALAYWGAR